MSAQIRRERDACCTTLERTQKGGPDIAPWQEWFLSCLRRAIDGSQETLARVLDNAHSCDHFAQSSLNVSAPSSAACPDCPDDDEMPPVFYGGRRHDDEGGAGGAGDFLAAALA